LRKSSDCCKHLEAKYAFFGQFRSEIVKFTTDPRSTGCHFMRKAVSYH